MSCSVRRAKLTKLTVIAGFFAIQTPTRTGRRSSQSTSHAPDWSSYNICDFQAQQQLSPAKKKYVGRVPQGAAS